MSMYQAVSSFQAALIKRATDDPDGEEPEAGEKEVYSSWALFILISLLICALLASYFLQTRRIQAVHETVISIFAGMVVGLVLRLTAGVSLLGVVTFDYQFFFNLLLPPIILNSGYELHQGNFFRNIGTILTFAFAGTFISAVVLAVILFIWSKIPLEAVKISFVEAMSVGATLSATDPVTILAIFNTYRVDPKLYTVIFGESILNDAIAIVLFETAQKYKPTESSDPDEVAQNGNFTILTLFESIGVFLFVFFMSLIIGLAIGIGTSLLLKFTHVRRFPKIESCVILLIAYASYFFSNAIHMSGKPGIVSLLFCGICMKHYAYHNMSRRTQLTTKFIFQILAQLSENFIFIYLGLSLFTDSALDFKPLLILITVIGICIARYLAVFPLSKAINWVIRYRARRRGREEAADELPYNHQIMLYWAGLRGAVGVALAAGLTGENGYVLKATVLVVVVLTVIIFGGTTSRMLEILNIRIGVVEEIDSDDEFDIEVVPGANGTYARHRGQGFGHEPRRTSTANGIIALDPVEFDRQRAGRTGTYVSGNSTPPIRPNGTKARRSSTRNVRTNDIEQSGLLSPNETGSFEEDDTEDLDLPPAVRRTSPMRAASPIRGQGLESSGSAGLHPQSAAQALHDTPTSSGMIAGAARGVANATGAIGQLFTDITEDPASAFRQIDEGFIKPHLLLDPRGGGHGGSNV
ncbi:sodium/hydrogen exchanger [Rhizodiscina lignyota]|uniref:Sodium/hydrogen exchanger n=1 Tax=Rhizodiscina lignyota TaxID=1504668 RepID=A0A9P4IAM3_9PEZI|nr:sodium/hydrogen exchanger [Rhizodiscina lignyota]